MAYLIFFIDIYKEFGETYGGDDGDLTIIGSIGFLSLAVGKLIGGTLLDYMKFKTLYLFWTVSIMI